ncbi:hypothetical protein [Paenibacillus sp.]|uniref:hypothetical protein n=1 Tax=Paenibacillus sp. TaxID=58172 RepID=UPI002D72CBFB|nr:hypothetical protein [Paenibacillus sp.]HZG85685.1 hypothetical protein [Paenibacillus sp.]
MTEVGEHAKGIAIALVGPVEIVERMMRVIRSFPSFRPVPVAFERREEAAERIASVRDEVEVVLAAGLEPVRKGQLLPTSSSVPIHYLPPTGAGVYRALLRVQRYYGLEGGFSVDGLSRTVVERTLRELELGLGSGAVFVEEFRGSAYASTEELAAFHAESHRAGRTAVALTGSKAVAERLTALGVPNEWVVPLDQDITVALERALLSTETRRSKESQIVVGLINVDDFGKLVRQRSSEHDVQRLKLDIHRTLLDYVESLNGYLTHLGGDEYLFFTTRGVFERETLGYKSVPLARDAYRALGLSLSIGIGFGQSANEAGTHARLALGHAKQAGGNACFIVREDRALIGPLEMADPVEYDLSLTDPALLERAEQAGMTRPYVAKLMAAAARQGRLEFNVQELAQLLGITVRSTHRLLLEWIDAGLIEVTGMEKVGRGRPRQRFRLAFLADRAKQE